MKIPSVPTFAAVVASLGIAMAAAQAADSARTRFGKQNPFRAEDLPDGKLKTGLQSLDPQAKDKAMKWLHTLDFHESDAAHHLRVDNGGGVFMVCPDSDGTCDGHCHGHAETGAAPHRPDDAGSNAPALEPATETPPVGYASVSVSSPPAYHSKPGATRRIYLDFNGGIVTGTAWNSSRGVNSWDVKAWSQDTDTTTFNDAEQAWMKRVWQRVAEDYAPFDVDVTTDTAYDPDNYTGNKDLVGWLLICETTDKNGVALPHSGSGGVAYVGVFGNSTYSPTYQPAWVSSTNGGGSESIIAEAASHEMGHNMGLSHDATPTSSYYGGHGTGDISWGPIMGTGYNRNVSQWCKGEYYNANLFEDDLSIISARVPYRADDHANTPGTATPLTITGGTTISSTTPESDPANSNPANKGIIERNTDVDVFSFYTGTGNVQLNANPWIQPAGTRGGNLDIVLELYNQAGTLVASDNSATLTRASISTSLAQGYYYLHVRNTGTGTPLASTPSGYTSYGSIGQYFISGTVVSGNPPPVITGITPTSGFANSTVTIDVSGTGMSTATSFKLTKSGQSDIPASTVLAVGSILRCQFNLSGTATGAWNVVATNPNLESYTLANAFTVVGAIWTETFDGLVTGWTSESTTGTNAWTLTTAQSHSPTKSYFAPAPAEKTTTNLISPSVSIPSGANNLQFKFWHQHSLQTNRDAGKLEFSVNGGAWFDAGSSGSGTTFASNGYNSTVSSGGAPSSRNEFAGQSAWSNTSTGFVETIVNLTDNAKFAGKSLRARWRIATNGGTASTGWHVDSISLIGGGDLSNQPPVIATTASSASTENVTDPDTTVYQIIRGASANLSVSATDDAGEPALTYTWSLLNGPGSPVVFSANGSNSAKNTTASFESTGDYQISVSVRDTQGLSASSSVNLRVVQNASGLEVTPGVVSMDFGTTQLFSATLLDQFNGAMADQPSSFTWSASGGGSINTAGLFSATAAGGPHEVTATSGAFSDSSGVTINPAAASVTITNLLQTYNGSPRSVTVTTTPPGLSVVTTYDGNTTPPVNASDYQVETVISDPNYQGSASDVLTVAKATATVTLTGLSQIYDGSPKPVGVTTNPAGLSFSVTYDGSSTPPSDAGNYPVVATINDPNYEGSANGVLTIAKATATVTLTGLSQTYDGSPKPVTVTTNPAVPSVSVTYDGSSTPPSEAGNYPVVATINDPNYEGSANGVLTIAKATATVTLTGLSQTYDGSPKPVGVTTNPTGLSFSVAYDGSSTPPSEAGNYPVIATVSDPNYEGTASDTLVIEAGNDYTNWVDSEFNEAQQLAGDAEENADPEADGLTNLAEYALGTDPHEFTPPLTATLDANGLTLIFTRPAGLPDIVYGAESSDGLGEWSPVPLELIAPGETETVRARDPLTGGQPPRKFIRLKFTRQ